MKTTDEIRDQAADIVEEFGLGLPGDRFSGSTPDDAVVSVTAKELVDLIEKVLTDQMEAES